MSFMGTYPYSIDPKGRVGIPVKFREALGASFVVTKGFDQCLCVYPFEQWQALEQKLRKLSITKKDMRDFTRYLFAGATEVELDKQGRILLPSILRQFAGLEKDVMVIGVSSRVEIWDKEKWEEYNEKTSESFGDIAENLISFDADFDLEL